MVSLPNCIHLPTPDPIRPLSCLLVVQCSGHKSGVGAGAGGGDEIRVFVQSTLSFIQIAILSEKSTNLEVEAVIG